MSPLNQDTNYNLVCATLTCYLKKGNGNLTTLKARNYNFLSLLDPFAQVNVKPI